MRVLMITSEWPTPEHPEWVPFIVEQVESLRREGLEIEVFAFRGSRSVLNYVKAWRQLRKQHDVARYDLIHAQFGQSGLIALPARIPLVVTFHGSDLHGIAGANGRYNAQGRVLRGISRWVARRAQEIIVVGNNLVNHLPAGLPVQVIPCGIDLDLFSPQPQEEARKRLGLSPGKRLVLFGANPGNPVKRYHLAQEVVERVKTDHAVELVPLINVPHDLVPAYMNACDVLLMTSKHEGSPTVLKEALACNLPVVSVDVGDVKERIGRIEGCVVCADESSETIAKGLTQVLLKGRRLQAADIVEELDGRRIAQQIIGVYHTVLEGRRLVKSDGPTLRQPFVTVVMPVRNEASFIERSLGKVLSQDYPQDQMEVIVADGMSTDGTREIIESLQLQYPNLRLIDNPSKIAPTALNAAIRQARGEIFVRVDGHCEIAPDYVRRCVEHLVEDDVDCVGGPIETIARTPASQSIALAMSSPFGVGGSAFRTVKDRGMLVETVAFPGYTRQVVEKVGLFDEELVRNQDDEYNYRLRKLGGRILLSPDIRSRYYSRSSLASLWRQYYQYGYWKVRVMQKHPRQMRLRQFVPALFVAALLASLLGAPFFTAGRWLLGLVAASYLFANLGASMHTGLRENWRLTPYLPATFATLHVSYGLGFLRGLIKFWNRWRDRETRSGKSAMQVLT